MNRQLNPSVDETQKFPIPIAVFGFNRPDLMRQQIERLRALCPSQLLVVLDGPRPSKPGESELCAEVSETLKEIDWSCNLEVLRSEHNLGCRKRVSSGITWVFSKVDRAIILEDDCSPHSDFFPYARELLERYADDPRVMHISGFSPIQSPDPVGKSSYSFSQFPMIWGWASWRRAWENYDESLAKWLSIKVQWKLFRSLPLLGYFYWNYKFLKIRRGFNTWDYQWTFACLSQGGLSALPGKNIMKNLGFRADATHTTDLSKIPKFETEALSFPLTHPEVVLEKTVNDSLLESMLPGFLR